MDAHAADLGLAFYTGKQFPAKYQGGLFSAQHGSWNRTTPIGARVMFTSLKADGTADKTEVFADGWLEEGFASFRRRGGTAAPTYAASACRQVSSTSAQRAAIAGSPSRARGCRNCSVVRSFAPGQRTTSPARSASIATSSRMSPTPSPATTSERTTDFVDRPRRSSRACRRAS